MKEYAPDVRASELSLVDPPPTFGAAPATPGDTAAVTDATVTAAPSPVAEPVAAAPAAATPDPFLAKATHEHASGYVDPALWARAVAQASDEAAATRIYLDSRATALRVAKRQEKAARRAQVVDVLSNAPDTGFTVEPPEGQDGTPAKETSRTRRRGARPSRRHVMLAAGVLGTVVVTVGLVALRAEGPDQEYNAAQPATAVSASGRSMPSWRKAAPAAANAGRQAGKDAPSEDFAGRVQALEKAGNWNLFVIHAVEWTRKQPGDADAWKKLSQGYVKLRQFGDALDAATKAVQLKPEDFLVWQNLGEINLALQRPEEALPAFQRATALNDHDVVSLVQEGILNTQLKRLPEAKIAFAKALAVLPEDVQALCGAATVAQKEGRAKDAEAITRQVESLGDRCRDPSAGESVRVAASGTAQSKPAAAFRR